MHGAAGASRLKTLWTRRRSAYVPGLVLRPDGKDEHGVDTGNIPVQRHVSGCAPADHQLAHVLATVAADQGAAFQHVEGVDDAVKPYRALSGIVWLEMQEDALEILPDLGRKFDPRHRCSASLLAVWSATRRSR